MSTQVPEPDNHSGFGAFENEFQCLHFDKSFYLKREHLLMNADFHQIDQRPQMVETVLENGELQSKYPL